jgi:UDP-N-acetylglucosamine 2-epimerase (non-hydrolysing)
MKIAALAAELRRRPARFDHHIVHTGQHYDDEMSRIFVDELALGLPYAELDVGSGTRAVQLARGIERMEAVLRTLRPDYVVVPGDVNSTLAAALAATTLDIPVAHVEAGLRSFDRTMPEETNRVLVDALAALLFTHSPEAPGQLAAEGCVGRVSAVGNTMIDTLVALLPAIEAGRAPERFGLQRGEYVLVTLHRPALVDTDLLVEAVDRLDELARTVTVAFPVHPRTRAALDRLGIAPRRAKLMPPLGYLSFVGLAAGASAVLTDSGGVQEETTYLGVPCFTLRDTTERPVTVEVGTNVLLGLDPARIADLPELIATARSLPRSVPPGWDGRAGARIVAELEAELGLEPDPARLALPSATTT